MMMRASAPSALAISTSCRSPWREPADRRARRHVEVDRGAAARALRSRTSPRSMNGRPRDQLGEPGDEQVLRDASGCVKRLSSWWMKAMPRACRVARAARRVGCAVQDHRARGRAGARRPGCSWSSTCRSRSRRPGPAPARAAARGRRRAAPGTPKKLLQRPSMQQRRSASGPHDSRWRCASSDRGGQDHPALDREHRGQRQAEQRQALVDDGEEQRAEHAPRSPCPCRRTG